jgi:hypothetical protein
MAFTTIPSTIIESGDPVTQELWGTYVKDNQDDHETRITSLEGGSAVFYWPRRYEIFGPHVVGDGYVLERIPFNTTLLGCRLLVHNAGTSSSTTIDVEYKRGAGSWTTVFSVKPSVASTDGDYGLSTNGVLSTTALLSGDLLRINVDTVQSGSGNDYPHGMTIFLEFEKT